MLVALAFAVSTQGRAAGADHDHDHDHSAHGEATSLGSAHLHSLDVEIRPQRDGMVEVEQQFRLEVDGISIQRGPILNYMTVFESSGGLILDTGMEVVSVSRGGEEEPFQIATSDGTMSLLVGSKDVLLEPGPHDYIVRYRHLGSWKKEGRDLVASFDVTEAFQALPIDHVTARLILPEGATFLLRSAAVLGTVDDGPGFAMTLGERVMTVETTAPLKANNSFFLNTSWTGSGFSGMTKWMQILRQHPSIPLAVLASFILLFLLWMLISGGTRREKERRLATAVA